ncbi:glycerophosphoryl diester phosphodiesterase membrane domain-containing protein [Microbispora sp. H10949]|uniref:glycerophosphoryl diester phosphodiesterase membrane domain-containing protein n=1 Tax=Microbispora sp. H10949 TaxID=2729111 RepID=UPI002175C250|nr:glycerophosphoryl diester phosphodiesterase membrane domain-containing protein [Microbispora sp. H10949]
MRPLTLGDIFDGTIKLIRSNPKATLGLSAIVAAVTAIPGALGQAVGLGMFGTALDGYGSGSYETAASPALPVVGLAAQYIGAIITYVMTFLGTTILTGILTRVLGRAVFGGRITVGEAWQLARSRVLALLGLALLQALILMAPVLVLAALLVALGLGDATAGAFVAVSLLFVLAYIPYAAFFYTRFSLAAPAVVLEGRGVTDAMARSWRLVRGGSWRVFGILVLTAVLVGIASSVLGVPFTIGGSLLGMFGGGTVAATVLTTILLAAGSVVASMITYPFQAGVAGLLYADRRMRAEAFDLVLQTAAAQNQSQGWVHTGVDDLWHPSHAAATGSAPGPGSPPYGTPPGASPYYGTPPYGPQA